ncbi:hypothetical protein L3Q82_006781 [Scortum barcoo]|uniref:Uncharacterized protein n=1 Tax=Scortum barcoo TaxID=214431 RepID=A0ACB8WWS7_9TELE|nr:hypothetical protein L3Q82_006781 [Scortum barcoo]
MVVPDRWKTSCLVPVPKKKHPSTHSDYRPVALTSHVMKLLERLVLRHLRTGVGPLLDPLQFAYQPQIGVEVAIIFLLHRAYTHLEESGSPVRVMFFDFSSAFNTIQPALLNRKLLDMQVDAPLLAWIHNYLTGRSHPATCRSFQMTAIVGCISRDQEEEYRSVVDRFVEWCGLNHLQLNVTKTKELVVDFRKQRTHLNSVAIRRLRSFNVCRTMLQIFYHSVVSSIIFYAVVCWGSRLKTADTNRVNKLIRRAGSVLGVELESVVEVSERRMLEEAP